MYIQKIQPFYLLTFLAIILLFHISSAQMITGVWHGEINNERVEVKMIQNGDSIAGTSYYYQSGSNYRRYTIKGYFDETENRVVWWDDQLIEDKTKSANSVSHRKKNKSKADFNCPGPETMKLDGQTFFDEVPETPHGSVHLSKSERVLFRDEWDYVIENYLFGANDPTLIDSVSLIAQSPRETNEVIEKKSSYDTTAIAANQTPDQDHAITRKQIVVPDVRNMEPAIATGITVPTIEQKFASRNKVFTREIPLSGDSIELRFYDNAEIDGDSISLFLNGRLIFEHIGLIEKAYVVKLAVNDLQDTNELTMVAENLGSIPPNTSYMVAIVGNIRYDAQLASSENSSAMIRLRKN